MGLYKSFKKQAKRLKKKVKHATKNLTVTKAKKVIRKETKGITKTFKPVKKKFKEKTSFFTEAGRVVIYAAETTGGFVTETLSDLEKGFTDIMHSDEFRMVASIYVNAIIGSALGAAGAELTSSATTWAKNIPEVKSILESDVVLNAMEAKDKLKEIEEYINKYEGIKEDPLKFFASELEMPSYEVADMSEYKEEMRIAKNAYNAAKDINTAVNDPTKFTTDLLKKGWRNRDKTDSTKFDLGLDFDIDLPKIDLAMPDIDLDLPKLEFGADGFDWDGLDWSSGRSRHKEEEIAMVEEPVAEEPVEDEEGLDIDIELPKRKRGKLSDEDTQFFTKEGYRRQEFTREADIDPVRSVGKQPQQAGIMQPYGQDNLNKRDREKEQYGYEPRNRKRA